jgi:hypothetical protein
MFSPASMSEPTVMERVLSMYAALPPQFRETPPTTGDMSKDLFGFQSANIQATLQLLRMVLLSAEEIGVDRKCDVAGELLSVFSKVPVEYLKAISSPLVSHARDMNYFSILLTCSASSPRWYRVYSRFSHGRKFVGRILSTSTNTTVSQSFHNLPT